METQMTKQEQPNAIMHTAPQNYAEECLAGDVVIPKLLLMQGLSESVSEGKAKMGDIMRSTTEEVLSSNKDEKIEIIPITFRNSWSIHEKVPGEKAKFRGTEPRTAGNDHLPWDFSKDGKDFQRVKVIELFALLPKDVETDLAEKLKAASGELPDIDKTLLPVVITFRSTGFKAGKTINTHFVKARANGVKPYQYSLSLGRYLDKNDKGAFYVWDFGPKSTPVKKEFYPAIEQMSTMLRPMVQQGTVVVDDKDESETIATFTGTEQF